MQLTRNSGEIHPLLSSPALHCVSFILGQCIKLMIFNVMQEEKCNQQPVENYSWMGSVNILESPALLTPQVGICREINPFHKAEVERWWMNGPGGWCPVWGQGRNCSKPSVLCQHNSGIVSELHIPCLLLNLWPKMPAIANFSGIFWKYGYLPLTNS